MSAVTQITFDNYRNHIDKRVEVEITCYAGGIICPDDNVLIGMNENTYYFLSGKDTDDEFFWHHTIEKDGDPKLMSHIQVWDYEEYKAYYEQSDITAAFQKHEYRIQDTYGYKELARYYPDAIKKDILDTLKYDVESIKRIQELKNKYFTASDFVMCAYLRDMEKNIAKKINE